MGREGSYHAPDQNVHVAVLRPSAPAAASAEFILIFPFTARCRSASLVASPHVAVQLAPSAPRYQPERGATVPTTHVPVITSNTLPLSMQSVSVGSARARPNFDARASAKPSVRAEPYDEHCCRLIRSRRPPRRALHRVVSCASPRASGETVDVVHGHIASCAAVRRNGSRLAPVPRPAARRARALGDIPLTQPLYSTDRIRM